MLKNTIQGILILIGILLSFHIEDLRIEQKNFEIKNELLSDLNRAISNDLEQINNLKEILKSALDSISELQDDMNKINEADWIIEVVVEKLEIKKTIFEKIEKSRKKGTLITSNTSGIPVKQMIEGRSLDFVENFCVTHFLIHLDT